MRGPCAWAALAVLASWPALSQTRLSLEELGARGPKPDFAPAHRGQRVLVRGVVSSPAFHFPDYSLLAIQANGWGGALHAGRGEAKLDAFVPGDDVEAEGVVFGLAGTPMIEVGRIRALGRTQPPAPIDVPIETLWSFPGNLRFMGRLVHVAGSITEESDTTAGGQVVVGAKGKFLKLFFPSASGQPDLSAFELGGIASATGVALQFCPIPPYDRFFEVLVSDPATVNVSIPKPERPLFAVPPLAVASGVAAILLGALFLWGRERRLRRQRERLKKIYQLGEEILSSPSAAAILKRISAVLPAILGITRVHLFVHNRAAKTLDSAADDSGLPVSISLSDPPAGPPAGAVACFSYRTLLAVPDIERSPFPIAGNAGAQVPRSLLFVPMLAQGEAVGVLELDQDGRARDFTPDEQALAQHLGNQIGVAIRLQDQRSVQEQLFRTEKLAAVGRLISGIANELRTPLSSISELAAKALERAEAGGAPGNEVSAISAEVGKAAGMVARLVAFGGSELVEVRPVCVSALLRDLIDFREGDWKASGIRIVDLTSPEPLFVLGSQGQLEQVFLNLLVHAEQSLADAASKTISIRSVVLNKRLVVEIAFAAPPESHRAQETASLLRVIRGVIAGHGGEARLVLKNNQDPCFEVEFPIAEERATVAAGPSHNPARRITAMVIEPDDAALRQLSALLTAQGCRVIPLDNADAGLELAQRMRFDLAFCSVHAPGLNWVELSERMQDRIGGFALLSDRYDAELSADFESPTRFVLPKPVQAPDIERVLYAVERPVTAT